MENISFNYHPTQKHLHAGYYSRARGYCTRMDDYLSKPVRPEDIRTIVERWALQAASTIAVAPLEQTPSAEPLTVPAAQSSEEAPVEIERLLDFTEGDDENLRELVTLYLEQTNGQIEQMEAAVQAGNASEVRRIAHHRSRSVADYYNSPRVSVSWGGEYIGWNSDFNQNGSIDAYVVPFSVTSGTTPVADITPPARPKGLRLR